MAEFTPGRWIYSGGYPAFVAAPDEDEPWNALKAIVCDLDARLERYERLQIEVDANGFLISAAPDLYEAVKGFLEWAENGGPVPPIEPMLRAVRKAEGRNDNV